MLGESAWAVRRSSTRCLSYEALHDLEGQWRVGGSCIGETSPRREAFKIMLSMPRGAGKGSTRSVGRAAMLQFAEYPQIVPPSRLLAWGSGQGTATLRKLRVAVQNDEASSSCANAHRQGPRTTLRVAHRPCLELEALTTKTKKA